MIPSSYLLRETEIASRVKQDDDHLYTCANIREALAWLRVGPFSGVTNVNGIFGYYNKKNYIFRGQKNAVWQISSTISRSDNKEKDQLATKLFAGLCTLYINSVLKSDILRMGPAFNEGFGICAAQHYQLKTNLIDWTVQPEIAVSFANDISGENEKGKIFMIETGKCIDLGLKVIIPPPIIKRLYLQRGLFIEHVPETLEELNKHIITIEFPHREYEIKNTLDYIAGDIELQPEDEWFNELREHCHNRVSEADFIVDYDLVRESFKFRKGFGHPYLKTITSTSFDSPSDELLAMLNNLICSLIIEYKNGRQTVNRKIFEHVKQHNQDIFETWDILRHPL